MNMRDPAGNAESYERFFADYEERMGWRNEEFEAATLERQLNYYCYHQPRLSQGMVLHRYGRGDGVDVIQDVARAHTALMFEDQIFMRDRTGEDRAANYPIGGLWRGTTSFAFLALLIVESHEYPALLNKLIDPDIQRRAYLTDMLYKAFIPEYSLLKKYKIDKYSAVWMDPIQRALAKPAEERADALALHMKSWCRLMRPWGWKPDLKPERGGDNLFCDFAFEVAAAVCAYDIDDSTFNDHPYYPRDLVEHYRTKVRHTRDAWRAHGVGAGVPVVAPPLPKKADLAKSKRKSVARWVELVCDGNIDVTEAVLETIGRPRKFDDISELMAALGESSEAVHADIKDDETTLIQAGRLADRRGLGEFDGPPGPPFGPARCRAGLLAFARWLEPHGYCLVDLDNDDDAWHAVVVRADYHAEFIELSKTLKIRTRTPEAVYND
jgi:hypothetical protein